MLRDASAGSPGHVGPGEGAGPLGRRPRCPVTAAVIDAAGSLCFWPFFCKSNILSGFQLTNQLCIYICCKAKWRKRTFTRRGVGIYLHARTPAPHTAPAKCPMPGDHAALAAWPKEPPLSLRLPISNSASRHATRRRCFGQYVTG